MSPQQKKKPARKKQKTTHEKNPPAQTPAAAAAPVADEPDDELSVDVPHIPSFRDFLENHARVPGGHGEYCQYSFEGREPLIEIVERIDEILGSGGKPVLTDATISICGGAQFGKSATELNLGAYCTGVAWLNWGFYLPDRDLVEGMVDTKFRPDILDQIDWFARMTQVGRTVNKSGKSVNRKGAFSVTNGKKRSHGMILGLNKVPTSYTFDVTALDEVDDIKPAREKFVRGRMTSSGVRLLVKIGTQRIAGRGQHKAWKDGSQGVLLHECPNPECRHQQNLEENWPRICRIRLGAPASRRPGEVGTACPAVPAREPAGGTNAQSNADAIEAADVVGRAAPCAPQRSSKIETLEQLLPLLPKGGEGRGEEANKNVNDQDAIDCEANTPHPSSLPALAGRGSRAPADVAQASRLRVHEASSPRVPAGGETPPELAAGTAALPGGDPHLTHTGDFRYRDTGPVVAIHNPENEYYFACTQCGTELNRGEGGFEWKHRRPERQALRHWSFRISQFAISAIDISQIVAEWVRAVADPEAMATFLCDRKAMPESTAQKLTAEILERARRAGDDNPTTIERNNFERRNMVPPLLPKGGEGRGEELNKMVEQLMAFECNANTPHPAQAGRGSKDIASPSTPKHAPRTTHHASYAGLDTGRRCWFFARDVYAADAKRVLHVEQIPLGNLVERTNALFHALGLQALFIDQAPATDEARTLALRLNGLETLQHWPAPPKDKSGYISLPGGLRWNGARQRWENLRCAVVAFTKRRLGAGISHGFDIFEKGSQTMFVPLIETNRFETIDRVVREFLTPSENVSEVVFAPDGQSYVRQSPSMRLPPKGPRAPLEHETLDEHLLAGSERVELRDGSLGDYVDACENHFLLANAYSGLAELEAGARPPHTPEPIQVFENTRRSQIISSRSTRQIEG